MRRLTATDAELAVLCEALRESMAAELLSPGSVAIARELLDKLDAKLPSAIDHHPAGPAAGRLMAGDEILRLLLAHETRYSYSALTNQQIAARLDWKPAGVSVRQLLEQRGELRCRGEADHTCRGCDVRWTIYLEATDRRGRYDPLGEPALCRPRWRYRGGWLRADDLAPPDHLPTLAAR